LNKITSALVERSLTRLRRWPGRGGDIVQTHVTLSLIAVLLFAGGIRANPGQAPEADPPSSLEPADPRGEILFSHRHRRVAGCEVERKRDKSTCRARERDADSATSLTLRPVLTRRLTGEDRREQIRIDFPSERGRLTQRHSLGVGDWEIDWPGHANRDRFRVDDGDAYEIRLRSISGKCRLVREACSLVTRASSRQVAIPAARRAEP
jgi:hypothetical protein